MAVSFAAHPSNTIVGWREWVSLPGLGVPWVKAKLDTGARTSAIHAFDIAEFRREGETWVRYSIHPWQRSVADATRCESRVVARRAVRSSSGHTQQRYVVQLAIALAGGIFNAEVTLSRRDEMGFRMLIGRELLRRGFLVDSRNSYLGGRPSASTRRSNRGR